VSSVTTRTCDTRFRNGSSVTDCAWWMTCCFTWFVDGCPGGHFVAVSRFAAPTFHRDLLTILHAGSRVASRRPGAARPRGISGAALGGTGCVSSSSAPEMPCGSPLGRSAGRAHPAHPSPATTALVVGHPGDLPPGEGMVFLMLVRTVSSCGHLPERFRVNADRPYVRVLRSAVVYR
jgi:hypothetical protein